MTAHHKHFTNQLTRVIHTEIFIFGIVFPLGSQIRLDFGRPVRSEDHAEQLFPRPQSARLQATTRLSSRESAARSVHQQDSTSSHNV